MSLYTMEAVFASGLTVTGSLDIIEGTVTDVDLAAPGFAPFYHITLPLGQSPPGTLGLSVFDDNNFRLTIAYIPNTPTLYEMQSATIINGSIIEPARGLFYPGATFLTGTIACAEQGPCQFHAPVPVPELGSGLAGLILIALALAFPLGRDAR